MPDIKITIGGDATQLQGALKSAQSELGKTAVAANKMDSSLQKVGKSGLSSIFNLTEKLRDLQSAVFTEKDRSRIAAYNTQIKNTQAEIAKLNTLTYTSGGGAFGGIASGAGKAFSAVRNLAYLLPGVGIAGLIGFAVDPIAKYIGKLFEATESEKKLAEQSKFLKEFNEETAKNYGKEITSLQILRGAIENTTTPMATRLQGIKDLKKEFPGLFDGLTNEQLLTGNVANAYDKATAAIIRKSRASAAEKALTNISSSKFGLSEEEFKDIEATNKKLKDLTDKTNKYISTATSSTAKSDIASAKKLLDILLKQEIDSFNERKKIRDNQLSEFNKSEQFYLDIALKGADQVIEIEKAKNKKLKKEARTIADVLKELRLELLTLTTTELQLGTNEARAKISALEGAIKELITKFGKPGKDNTVQLFAEIRDIQFVEKLRKNLETSVKGEEFKITPVIAIDPIIKPGILEERLAQYARDNKIAEGFNEIIQSTVIDGLSGLGEAIGNAIGGGGLEGIFTGLFKTIGNGLKELGRYLIKTYGLIAIVDKIKFSNPVLGIAAGVALVALGALISAKVNNPKAFATGVRNFQPSGETVLVGERGPEKVFLPRGSTVQPNNELIASSGGQQVMIPDLRIDGSTFVIGFKRAEARMNRNGSISGYGI